MSCYYHEGREEVAVCPQCGKQLCRDCASLTQEGLCYNCAMANNETVKNVFIKDTVWFIVLLIGFIVSVSLLTNYGFEGTEGTIGIIIFVLVGVGPAWRLLSRNTKSSGTVYVEDGQTVFGLLIFKGLLALFLSIFMPISYFIKFFVNLRNFIKVKKNITAIKEHWEYINS